MLFGPKEAWTHETLHIAGGETWRILIHRF
jgi:hypothetical protein